MRRRQGVRVSVFLMLATRSYSLRVPTSMRVVAESLIRHLKGRRASSL